MTHASMKNLSRELHTLADEASDHLKDAARKTGADATDAINRSAKAISRAADRLHDEALASAEGARNQVRATVRAHPVAASTAGSVIASVVVALVATFALVRLSQL